MHSHQARICGSKLAAKNIQTRGKRLTTITLVGLVSVAASLVMLSLTSTTWQAEANSIVQPSDSHQLTASSNGGLNNFDNLINDFLDDAGNRLKKSKLNSMRQIKPTLRFGRRSDPLMAPSLADLMDSQDQFELNQRRLLAAALVGADNRRRR